MRSTEQPDARRCKPLQVIAGARLLTGETTRVDHQARCWCSHRQGQDKEAHRMEGVESIFRRVEEVLDDLLKKDNEQFRSVGLVIEDHSGRTYHYKSDHLCWFQVFRKEMGR